MSATQSPGLKQASQSLGAISIHGIILFSKSTMILFGCVFHHGTNKEVSKSLETYTLCCVSLRPPLFAMDGSLKESCSLLQEKLKSMAEIDICTVFP